MEISARRSTSYNLYLPTSPVAPCLPILCPGFPKMYSSQHMDTNRDPAGQRMYSTSPKMGVQSMHPTKQENVIQSTLSAFTNLISEHLLRATSSIIPNTSLSVTIVPNEGIIPEDFYQTLNGSKEKQFYNNVTQHKESLFGAENVYNIAAQSMKSQTSENFYKKSGKTSLECNPNNTPLTTGYKGWEVDENLVDYTKPTPDKSAAIMRDRAFTTNKPPASVGKENQNEELSCTNSLYTDEAVSLENTLCKKERVDGTGVLPNHHKETERQLSDSISEANSSIVNKGLHTTNNLESHEGDSSPSVSLAHQNVFSNLFTDLSEMVQKVVNHVSDRLHFRAESPDCEIPSKRPYSPRPRCKQTPVDVARGRGRGRGRSQLRRSGVSQARHRQERIRQSLSADIQDDLDDWHEFEELQNKDVPSTPSVDENGTQIRYDVDGTPLGHSPRCPLTFAVFELKPRKRKQKKTKTVECTEQMKVPTRVRYVPDCLVDDVCKRSEDEDEFDAEKRAFRPRLLSESSVDSEDSCCIVFETGSDSEYETDYDYETTSEEEDEAEDEDRTPRRKVRFAPTPTVHTMVKWDYAYRAARRGPWEEMARDRERFKGRINCIGRVLNPILSPQYRSYVWQQRFATEV